MRRDQGIQSSADHADADEEGWTRQALGMLTAYAAAFAPSIAVVVASANNFLSLTFSRKKHGSK